MICSWSSTGRSWSGNFDVFGGVEAGLPVFEALRERRRHIAEAILVNELVEDAEIWRVLGGFGPVILVCGGGRERGRRGGITVGYPF